MRVIAGKAKSFTLFMVPGDVTRPIMDRVKESLFNILAPYILDKSFLDLFAGTGSVGIEALSRGSKFTRLIEENRVAVKTILANLEHTGLEENAEVWRRDAFDFLRRKPDRQFDFIYVAPPQYEEMWIRALQMIDENTGWLFEHSWVIVQIDPIEYQDVELRNLTLFDRREYGSTELLFYYLGD
ncbi:MAG: Ribosomal RNA small subunit methyltransferase D [Chloroflexi bacterium]|nr:Ribosomal RNA small subunit methyltransferase D [Chloroflexota bacterium]